MNIIDVLAILPYYLDLFMSAPDSSEDVEVGVATKIFEGFGEALFMEFIKGREPVSSVHYTRPGTSIKQPTPNYLATQRHVNWPVIYPKSSYKIMDPVSAALPQNLRRIFVAT